jgi:hypothetical protein
MPCVKSVTLLPYPRHLDMVRSQTEERLQNRGSFGEVGDEHKEQR